MALVDEKVVLKFYLEQIENDNVKFLKGKDSFKNSISEQINYLLIERDMHNRIKIAKYLTREPGEFNMSIENEIKFIKNKANNDKEIFLTAKVNGNIVGTLGFTTSSLKRYQHKGQFGIAILKEFWNYGIGSKLIETMINWADNNNFLKICLEVDSNNERAIKLYEKFGFQQEGILKFDKYLEKGVYIDSIIMSRINKER